MDTSFETLVPFVVTGVIIGFYFTAGGASAGRRMRPPPFFNAGDNPDAIPREFSIHLMADFWSAVRSIYELSITSGTEFARANQASTFDDARAMLLSATRAHGWTGLESIVTDALSSLGTLRHFDAGVITRDEHTYVHQLICHVLVGVLYSHSDSLLSPGVLRDISSSFARTGHFPPASLPFPSLGDDDGTMGDFVTSVITTTATLVIALIHHVDHDDPEISHAFHRFAQNPALWSQYIQMGSLPSVEEIVRAVHRDPTPAHIQAVDAAPRPPTFVIGILAFFNIRIWSDGNTTDIDTEAGIGGFILRDGDLEYIAALFVAALIRFHAGPGANTPQHAG